MHPPAHPDRPAALPESVAALDSLLADVLRLRGRLEAARGAVPPDSGASVPAGVVAGLAPAHTAPAAAVGPDAVPRPGEVGTAEWNLVTDAVHWSAEVFRLFGLDPAAGALTLDQLPAYLLPDDQLPLQQMITAALVDGCALDGRFRVVRPDGTVRAVHCAGEPVLGPDGHVMSLWTVLRDVTGRNGRPQPPKAPSAPPKEPPAAEPTCATAGPVLDVAVVAGHDGWYDMLPLPDGGTLVTLGRAAGPGPQGAGDAETLRHALRGMAMTGATPARMLHLLDQLLLRCGQAPAVALCCRYRPGIAALEWAAAGHRAPLLVRAGAARPSADGTDATPCGAPLGTGPDAVYRQQRIPLLPGDVVLCPTGEPDLAALQAAAPALSAADSAAGCLERLAGSGLRGALGLVLRLG